MLNQRSVAEDLSAHCQFLKEECCKLGRCEQELALETASKLGIATEKGIIKAVWALIPRSRINQLFFNT